MNDIHSASKPSDAAEPVHETSGADNHELFEAREFLNNLDLSQFRTVRRNGYDPQLVEHRLQDTAYHIRRLLSIIEDLSQRVEDLSQRVTELANVPPQKLTEQQLTTALGEETVRVLEAARVAASKRIEHVELERTAILDEARAMADEIIQESRTKGRQTVNEARKVRETILSDLANKRNEHRVEVEQTRAVRDQMLESLTSCQQNLDGLISTMIEAVPQAIAAAERAGLRIASSPMDTATKIETEIETARLAGIPISTLDKPPPSVTPYDNRNTGNLKSGLKRPETHAGHESAENTGSSNTTTETTDEETRKKSITDVAVAHPTSQNTGNDASNTYSEDIGSLLAQDIGTPESSTPSPIPSTLKAAMTGDQDTYDVYDIENETPDVSSAAVGDSSEISVAVAKISNQDTAVENVDTEDTDDNPVKNTEDTENLQDLVDEEAATTQKAEAQHTESASRTGKSSPVKSSNVEDIFARLRSITSKFSSDVKAAKTPEKPVASKPKIVTPKPVKPPVASKPVKKPVSSKTRGRPQNSRKQEDNTSSAGSVAVEQITRKLRRAIMEDQNDLLDAIRRMGHRAITSRIKTRNSFYAGVLRQPFQQFVSNIDASIDDLDIESAKAAIDTALIEPVRSRLEELADATGSVDTLNTKVRAIYRESRSRRAALAAEAAVAAAWPSLNRTDND